MKIIKTISINGFSIFKIDINSKLLENLSLYNSISSFFEEFLENSVRSQLYESINNIAVAYRDNNKKQLKKILKENLEKYQNQNKDILFQVAIASNFYEDLSGDRVCPLVVKNKVILYFSDVVSNENFWCYEDIFYFNLITQILDARHLYGFSLKLLEYVRNNRINSKKRPNISFFSNNK